MQKPSLHKGSGAFQILHAHILKVSLGGHGFQGCVFNGFMRAAHREAGRLCDVSEAEVAPCEAHHDGVQLDGAHAEA